MAVKAVKTRFIELQAELQQEPPDDQKIRQMVTELIDFGLAHCEECGTSFIRIRDPRERFCSNLCGSKTRMRRKKQRDKSVNKQLETILT